MKIDFSKPLLGLDGNVLRNEGKELTLGGVSQTALMNNFQGETASGEEKFKRFIIAQQIVTAKLVELPIEDIALIKEFIGRAFGPAVVGPAYELLENSGKGK